MSPSHITQQTGGKAKIRPWDMVGGAWACPRAMAPPEAYMCLR